LGEFSSIIYGGKLTLRTVSQFAADAVDFVGKSEFSCLFYF